MSERTVIRGLIALDEQGNFIVWGGSGHTQEAVDSYLRSAIDLSRRDKRWGTMVHVYEMQLDVPRPLLSQLSLKISAASSTQLVTGAQCRAMATPATEPAGPQPPPNPFRHRPTQPACDQTEPGDEQPPEPSVEAPAAAEPGDTILDRIEQKLRAAGGALPWTQIEYLRPVAITHQVFLATVSKRFTVEKRGRGLRVKLKEDQR